MTAGPARATQCGVPCMGRVMDPRPSLYPAPSSVLTEAAWVGPGETRAAMCSTTSSDTIFPATLAKRLSLPDEAVLVHLEDVPGVVPARAEVGARRVEHPGRGVAVITGRQVRAAHV